MYIGPKCQMSDDRQLSLASYCAKSPVAAYVEPLAVGMRLTTDMSLFLTPAHYVNVPLEETYTSAWRGIPGRWRNVIAAPDS